MSDELSLEELNGLVYVANADLPFGKVICIGNVPVTIYERAIAAGYQAGIDAHVAHIKEQGKMEALTDVEFTRVLDAHMPTSLSGHNQELWRAYFIVGWTWVFLDLPRFEASQAAPL